MNISSLVNRFIDSKKWTVDPPSVNSQLSTHAQEPEVTLPQDVLDFYTICGGLRTIIKRDEDIFLSIVPYEQVMWAPAEILGSMLNTQLDQLRASVLWYWYIIGKGDTDELFVIDLAPGRYSNCYFTTVYTFGQRGLTPIVAHNFTELLERFLYAASVGEEWSWKEESFGDAYQ